MGFSLAGLLGRRRAPPAKSHLLEFYGVECDHCVEMHPLMDQLQAETGLTLRGFEVWFNQSNLKRTLVLSLCVHFLFVVLSSAGRPCAGVFSCGSPLRVLVWLGCEWQYLVTFTVADSSRMPCDSPLLVCGAFFSITHCHCRAGLFSGTLLVSVNVPCSPFHAR